MFVPPTYYYLVSLQCAVACRKALLRGGQRPVIDFDTEGVPKYGRDLQWLLIIPTSTAPPQITVVAGQALVPPLGAEVILDRTGG
jgi:hypothetical protein